jgi:PKD repeat protein
VTIDIGGAAAGRVAISANPTNVSASGGTSTITAVVFDTSGNRLPGVPVSFATTAGALSASVVNSDSNGEARTTLTTSRTATVTATVSGGETAPEPATVEITALAIPVVSVTPTPASPFAGQPVTFAITTTLADGTSVRSLTVDFGDGQTASPGPTTSVSHVYTTANTYTVRVTVEDTNGSRGTGSTTVVVQATPLPLVTVTPSATALTVGQTVTFTVAMTPQGGYTPIVQSVFWDFGDGNTATTNGLTRSHIYGVAGNMRVTATLRFADGNSARGETAVSVR